MDFTPLGLCLWACLKPRVTLLIFKNVIPLEIDMYHDSILEHTLQTISQIRVYTSTMALSHKSTTFDYKHAIYFSQTPRNANYGTLNSLKV